MNFIFECALVRKILFCHSKIKFISSSHRVMFFLLYRQKDIDKVIEGNDRNYVIDKLTCEIMENKPLRSRMYFYEFYEWYIFQYNTRVYIIITNYTLLSLLFSLFRIFETRSSNSYCKRFCNKLKSTRGRSRIF